MKKNFEFPAGTRFLYDTETRALTLASLCGMTCGHNEKEYDYSCSGLAVICVGSQRLEGEKLCYEIESASENEFRFSAADAERTVRWESNWTFDPESGVISCCSTLTNTSGGAVTVRRALPRWVFTPGEYEVCSLLNRWAAENQLQRQALRAGDVYLHGRPARSTSAGAPFCILKDVENQTAAAFHVLPRGNWTIQIHSEIVSNESPAPVVEAGLSDKDLFHPLAPGEQLELPEVLIAEVPGGDLLCAGAPLHRYMVRKRIPAAGLHQPPLVYNSWLYRFTDFTVEQLREQLQAAREIGCEVFMVDAGWFGAEAGWQSVGDWREKEGRPFFGNMSAFADEVRAAGLKFGFWLEPERCVRGVPVREEHPEWFPDHSLRIDLTQPAAAEYFHDIIADNVRKFGAEYIKLDFNNVDIGYDESGTELHNYCSELNRQLLRIRKEFPGLVIENCGSGGLRCDLATSLIYDLAFISDNAHPYETLRIRQGLFLRFPPGRVLNWLVMRPAPERRTPVGKFDQVMACTSATWDEAGLFNLDYVLISGLLGILGFSGDLAGFDPGIRGKIEEYARFYKENRRFITDSRVYLLTPPDPSVTDYEKYLVFQMSSEESPDSLLFVFTHNPSRRSVRNFRLRGLDVEKRYRVVRLFAAEDEETIRTGAELMRYGVRTQIPESMHSRHSACLYRISPL